MARLIRVLDQYDTAVVVKTWNFVGTKLSYSNRFAVMFFPLLYCYVVARTESNSAAGQLTQVTFGFKGNHVNCT